MDDNLTPLTIHTPRRSKVGLVGAFILLLLSAGLCVFAYWGWQQHVGLGSAGLY